MLAVPLMVAVIDWIAIVRNWRWLDYICKPGTIIALLFWMASLAPIGTWRSFLGTIAVALILSMAGDIFLMLPRERFMLGLIAFMLAHVAYIIGFNLSPFPSEAWVLILPIVVLPIAWFIYRRIDQGLVRSDLSKLRAPVLIYSLVITVMLLSVLSVLGRETWSTQHAVIAGLGAGLFFISDGLLAWNRFVFQIRRGRLLIRISYHIGQIALVTGAVLHAVV